MLIYIKLLWLICAVFTAGWYLAYFQGEYPEIAKEEYSKDLRNGWLFGLMFGPVNIFPILVFKAYKYGFMNPFKL